VFIDGLRLPFFAACISVPSSCSIDPYNGRIMNGRNV